jgi:ribose-phosphate pyrophosphokinase
MLTAAGVDRVITMDLHADQIQLFQCTSRPSVCLSPIYSLHRENGLENVVVCLSGCSGTKRANTYAKMLGTDMVICHKSRARANVVGSMTLIGDVTGKDVIIVDDLIDTAGTITKAADLMMEKGAHSVRAFAAHGVLSGPAYERIEKSALNEVYFTDSIPPKQESSKIKYISVADAFAEAIERVYKNHSISSMFYG